jgi:hypothetical protein
MGFFWPSAVVGFFWPIGVVVGFFCMAVLGMGFFAPWTTFVVVVGVLTEGFLWGVVMGVFFAVDVTGVFFVPMGWATMLDICDAFDVVCVYRGRLQEMIQLGARWNGVYGKRYPRSMSLISLVARKLASDACRMWRR